MESSSVQHQEMSGSLESMLVCTKPQQENKKPRPQPEQALKCPRCDSTNTKFCYYNNYSLSQPRYFCKSCRRYWTKGGTLRNVPVGGGCRKNRRSSSSSSSSSSKRAQDQQLHTSSANSVLNGLPGLSTFDSSDLLAFARFQKQASGQFGLDDHDHDPIPFLGKPGIHPSDALGNHGGFLDSLRHGFLETHQSNFQNFYYGANAGDPMENVGGGGEMSLGYDQEVSGPATTAVTMTTMKQELCSGAEGENRILWGFPWQLNANYADGGNMMGGDLDPARGSSWNNGLSSSWQGLLNSPLM